MRFILLLLKIIPHYYFNRYNNHTAIWRGDSQGVSVFRTNNREILQMHCGYRILKEVQGCCFDSGVPAIQTVKPAIM